MLLKLASLVFILASSSRALCPEGMNATGTPTNTQGDAKRYVPPDVSKIRLAIEGTASTIAEATSIGKTLVENISKRLEGVNSTSIRPYNLDWETNYPKDENDYEDTSKKPEDYTFSQNLDIVTTPDELSKVIESAIGSGDDPIEIVDVVSYVSTEKQIEVMNELRTDAIKTAMETAKTLAREAGGEVGSIVSVSDSSYLTPIPDVEYSDPTEEVSVSVYLGTEFCL